MTKQEFLNGKSFRVNQATRIGQASFRYECNIDNPGETGHLRKEIRRESTGEVVLDDYELSITKITDNTFSGQGFVMDKRVNIRYRFDQLIPVE
jgi:hypothetical protein